MKKTNAPTKPISRERLNQLMDAMALIIVRRQMKHRWTTGHRAALPSII